MNPILNQPLSMDEIKTFHLFLNLPHEEAKPMSITKAHGFLTAVLSSPKLIMPSQWQPVILGGHPDFKSIKEIEKIMELISRFNNQISKELRESNPFEPLLFTKNQIVPYQEASFELIGEWCRGYLEGSKLGPPFNEEEAVVLVPFAHLAGLVSFTGQEDKNGNIIEEEVLLKEKIKHKLPDLIKDLFITWHDNRKKSSPSGIMIKDGDTTYQLTQKFFDAVESGHFDFPEPVRNLSKTGRNDPCPCGSNKKHKKCCLNNMGVH